MVTGWETACRAGEWVRPPRSLPRWTHTCHSLSGTPPHSTAPCCHTSPICRRRGRASGTGWSCMAGGEVSRYIKDKSHHPSHIKSESRTQTARHSEMRRSSLQLGHNKCAAKYSQLLEVRVPPSFPSLPYRLQQGAKGPGPLGSAQGSPSPVGPHCPICQPPLFVPLLPIPPSQTGLEDGLGLCGGRGSRGVQVQYRQGVRSGGSSSSSV